MIDIRVFTQSDREQASDVICRCLREVNSHEYKPSQINRLCEAFSPENVDRRFSKCSSYVAVKGKKVVGTATLNGNELGSVFVNPDLRGQGIGKILTLYIESVAKESGVSIIKANSSLSAIDFYRHLGYKTLGENHEPDGEVTIEIEKEL